LSDEKDGQIKIFNLAEEMGKGSSDSPTFSHLGQYIDISDDGFAALNTALLSDGAVIFIPEGTKSEKPINLIFYSDGKLETIVNPRVLVVAGENSSASIIESYVGGSDQINFNNSVSEIYVGKSSSIYHYRLMDEEEGCYDVGYGRAVVHAEGKFHSRAFFKGGNLGRYDLKVEIAGDSGSCDLQGLYFTSGSQHMDNFINIDHQAPNGTSNLFYKGILDGRSRAVFGGTVLVRKEAQKTDSVQTDKNLLLSSNAEVDSKPALFIYADDVKCAHGATAGNIDEDTVFYMRSRGVDLEEASRLLIYGFAEEIINKVELNGLRTYLQSLFLSSLPTYRFEF
jgi:Fe-S cluster assembly protein SufD